MSTDRDVTRIVRSWLHEDAYEDADRILNLVLDEVDTTPQRRAGWLARRFPIMNTNIARLGVASAVVVLAIIIGINFLPGSYFGGPPEATPSPSEAAPSPSAAASPKALPLEFDVALTPGTYSLAEGFPVAITFDVPTGWVACSPYPVEQGACQKVSNVFAGVGVAFTIIDNVVADPCAGGALLDPPVGPSVDDLVTAISNLEGFEATTATDVTLDGFDGKQFTLTDPSSPACGDMKTWANADGTYGVGAGEIQEMWILDVGGVRVVIAGTYLSTSTEEELSALRQVIASTQIEP